MGVDGFKNLLAHIVLLQQVTKGQDRGLIWDLALISSMPAERRMVGTAISAPFIAGSLSEYHCCNAWIRNIVADGYGGLQPFLLVLGYWGSIRSISACKVSNFSNSERSFSHLVCFLAVVTF